MATVAGEQIKLFRSLFSGRDDAYGKIVADSPVCVREPLTDQVLLSHLNGTERIGCYPILKNGSVPWAVIDFDTFDRKKVEAVIATFIDHNLFPYVEISRGKGYHVWLFFDDVVPANAVRKLLKKLLRESMIEDYELFPKQDALSSDNGVGNFVFFPLHGESVKENRTVFLNAQFNPYENQWEHLSKVHKTKAENILSMVQEAPKESKVKPLMTDTSTPPRGVKVCYWKALNEGVEAINPGRHRMALRLSKYLQVDQGLSADIAKAALIQWNQNNKPPLTEREFNLDRTIADGLKYDWGCNDEVLKTLCSSDCKYYKPKDQETDKDRGLPKDLFQIIDEPEREEIPLIETLLYPGDKGFVVSMYKMGKTLFLMQMALCLSMAVPFLGLAIPQARKVLYIRFELKDSRFRKRLNIMLPTLGGREKVQITPLFHMVRGFDIKNEKDFSWLLNMIYKFEPEVLFLDPYYKLSLSTDLKKDDGSGIIRRFDNLMGRFPNLHVSTAHHLRKQVAGPKDDSWDSAYGSVWLFADMDYEIRISRKGAQKDTFVFSHISNDVPIENFTFKRNPISLLYEIETKEDIRERWVQDTDRVIEQVRSGGDVFKQKGNLKTWLQSELGYARREAEGFLDFLFESKKLAWIGKTPKKGYIEASESDEDSNQEHENDLFS